MAQPAFLKEGLVAYYPFNGNANDESGNGNDGVVTGVQWVESYSADNKKCAFFDGVSFINIQDVDSLNFNKNAPFTISFWINSQSRGHMLGKRDGLSFCNYQAYTDGVFLTFLGDPYTSLLDTRIKLPVNADWIHAVCAWNGDICKLYLNGNMVFLTPLTPLGSRVAVPLKIGGSAQFETYKGQIDNLRLYSKALSDIQVKSLYDYESTSQPLNSRIATATAQVVNGFVVGATITDDGYGYVENPVVTINGGGGSGAKATATQFNGVVTSITITNPGIGYTSAPTITIAPPPFPPRKATSTAQIVNGFVVGTKITDGGFGYDSPPAVLIVGGGGSGAVAVATVANGVVTAITITNPGTGYTSVPIVRIASPPFAPKLGIETSKVFVRMSVVLGRKYQLEASTDLNSWTTTSPAFIAQDEELAQEFDVNQVGRYFRINQVP